MRPSSRALVFIFCALAHAGLFLLMVDQVTPVMIEDEAGGAVLSFYDGKALRPSSTPPSREPVPTKSPPPPARSEEEPKPPPPPETVDPVLLKVLHEVGPTDIVINEPASTAIFAASQSAPQALAVGKTCQLSQWIQQTLQTDPAVFGALTAIPLESRSVAGAIMLWDGEWVEHERVSPAGLETIREAIISGVRSAPAGCTDATIEGPLFIAVQDGLGVTLVTIGSGQWRWADMLPVFPDWPWA
ncbi:MAG: hypothetical protein QE280_15345 [Caulobacter sp.]|nr:hypothetical protein [Caulobacter sp.]